MVNNGKLRYAWITGLPALFLAINTISAGLIRVFHPDKAIGFLTQAEFLKNAIISNTLPATIPSVEIAHRVIFNNYVNAFMAILYVSLVLCVIAIALYRVFVVVKKSG